MWSSQMLYHWQKKLNITSKMEGETVSSHPASEQWCPTGLLKALLLLWGYGQQLVGQNGWAGVGGLVGYNISWKWP